VTDGTNLYHAFKSSTNPISTTIQTKLWEFGSSLITKQALKAGVEVVVPNTIYSSTLTIDTETNSNTFNFNSQNLISWSNNIGNIIAWQNNLPNTVGWLASGFTYIMQDVTNYGKYLGLTLTSTTPQYQTNALMLEFEDRARW
jgi:hypothetical protein